MKIIILGAGQVGKSMADILSREANDVTLVDRRPDVLRDLQGRMDVRTVAGEVSSPEVLERAGAEDADMILTVTDSDEVNMVACQVAHTLFHTPTKIARVRSSAYLAHRKKLFSDDEIPIDVIISPENIITNQIQRLIEYPGALQVIDFAGGKIRLVGLKAFHGGALVGHELQELKQHLPSVKTRVAAIYREQRAFIPDGKTIIEPDDEVFFIATRDNIRKVMQELRSIEEPGRKIMIVGAGNIGLQLAKSLEHGKYQIKLIEHDTARAEYVSEQLEDVVVLRGDAGDEELLREEGIENMELFCALTNGDEINILSAMLAKRLGTRRVIAIINRSSNVDLIESIGLDTAISPRQSTVSAFLSHVRRGDVVAAHSLRRGAAEALEAVAHGNSNTSAVVGRKLLEIHLPPGASISAIMRNDDLIELDADTRVEDGDHVIIFVTDKSRIHEVEKLFQVAADFI